MRKLVLTAAALLLASQLPSFAGADLGPTRGLTLPSFDIAAAQPAAAAETRIIVAEQARDDAPAPAAAAPKDAAKDMPKAVEAPKDVAKDAPKAEVPAAAAETKPVPRPALKVQADDAPAPKVKAAKAPVRRVRRESDEHKARRIAAKYGVSW
jgi:hypothetical protein